MKHVILAMLAFCHSAIASQAVLGQNADVDWLRSATEAADEAGRTGKPILVYVRSASCHYCDLMQRDVWQDPTASAVVRREFVPLKLTREENAEAVASLGIKGFPTTLVFSPERKFLHRIDGYVKPEKFLAEMDKAQTTGAMRMSRR